MSHIEYEGANELTMRASTLVWTSVGGLMRAADPSAALIYGLLTVVSVERPSARFALVDLEPNFDQSEVSIAKAIIQQERLLHQEPFSGPRDREFIMEKGCLHISRMIPDEPLNHWFKLQEGLDKATQMLPLERLGPVRLAFTQPGLLNSLYFKPDDEYLGPLKDDHVEIKTCAVGLDTQVGAPFPCPTLGDLIF